MAQEWFYTSNGQQRGPVTFAQLQQLVAGGKVTAGDLVWCEGMPQWVLMTAIPGLCETPAPQSAAQQPAYAAPAPAIPNAYEPAPAIAATYIPQYAMADPYYSGRADSTIFAGFWLRFFASIIDGILFLLILLPVFAIFFWMIGVRDPNDPNEALSPTLTVQAYPALRLIIYAIIGGIGWLYFALQESSTRQATLGKRALGLVVTDTNGQRISFFKATGRHFGKILSQLFFYYGYIMAGTSERKQALHDMLASCLVVIKNH